MAVSKMLLRVLRIASMMHSGWLSALGNIPSTSYPSHNNQAATWSVLIKNLFFCNPDHWERPLVTSPCLLNLRCLDGLAGSRMSAPGPGQIQWQEHWTGSQRWGFWFHFAVNWLRQINFQSLGDVRRRSPLWALLMWMLYVSRLVLYHSVPQDRAINDWTCAQS